MSIAAFSLLLLASGYIALRCTPFTRFHIFHTEGHGLYFLVVTSALAVSAFTAIATHELFRIPFLGRLLQASLENLLKPFTTDAKVGGLGSIAVLSVPIAFVTAKLIGFPLYRSSTLRSRLLVGLNSVGELEEFLWTSVAENLPVMFTMSSGTAYIGTGIDTTAPRDHRQWIRVEPLLSGFIDEGHRFCPIAAHTRVRSRPPIRALLIPEKGDVLLPLEEVRSVQVFDLAAYEIHLSGNANAVARAERRRMEGPLLSTPKAIHLYTAYVGLLLGLPIVSLVGGPYLFTVAGVVCVLLALASALPEEL